MEELLTVLTRKGQITVPLKIREALQLKEGDKVAVTLQEGAEQAIIRRVASVADQTFGAVTPRKRPEDMRELRAMFEEEVANRGAKEGR